MLPFHLVLAGLLAQVAVPAAPVPADDPSGASVGWTPMFRAAPAGGDDGKRFHWYGAPMLVVDAVAVPLTVASLAYNNDHPSNHLSTELALVGLGIYLLDGAVVHGLNHQSGHALKSVLLRVGGFLAGFAMSLPIMASGDCASADAVGNRPGDCQDWWIPFALGPLAAIAIDDFFLARSPVVDAPPAPAHTSWAPRLRLAPGLALMGLGGTF